MGGIYVEVHIYLYVARKAARRSEKSYSRLKGDGAIGELGRSRRASTRRRAPSQR